jgi:hypothetical protein
MAAAAISGAGSKAKQLAFFWSNFTDAPSHADRCAIDSGIENRAITAYLAACLLQHPDAEAGNVASVQ